MIYGIAFKKHDFAAQYPQGKLLAGCLAHARARG
jgi:hypothetical protein